jgi:Ca2+-binding EF-hand superfamily protein
MMEVWKMRYVWAAVLACSMLVMGGNSAEAAAEASKKPKPTPEEAFKKRDKNSDGALCTEEFVGKRAGDKADKAKKIFAKKDKDASGSLSLEEFTAKVKGKKKDA